MAIEMFTYRALGERLGCSAEAARALAKRLRLSRQLRNDGKAVVVVDVSEITYTPASARSPAGDRWDARAATETLKAGIAELEAELAKVEATSAGHREDFERERARVDQLLSELLTATAELMAAKEATGRLEGELAALRAQQRPVTSVPVVAAAASRPWWRRRSG